MPTPALELQKAIYTKLSASPFQGACGVSVSIFDHVPSAAQTPYVIISDIQTDGAAAQAYDASDLHANLVVYSSRPGKVELHTIAGAIRAALAPISTAGSALTLQSHRIVTWRHHQTLVMDDPDGISVKATVMLEFNTEPL